ncbi:NTP transferase domain-containing protein [Candidatus Acetothermia bacterium]|nr:NTP transferase domain-containing protein [Candidatus Acetothermia bacterium]
MYAVVLAAGAGTRLASISVGLPKSLVILNEKPLLAHVLQRLERAGFAQVIIVTGFQSERVEEFLKNFSSSLTITTVHNTEYQRENGFSLLCARSFMSDRFVLAMGDHIVDPEIYRVAGNAKSLGLCVDRAPSLNCQTNDATRVWVEDEKIVRIGKELTEWNALDTGIFSLTPKIFEALDSLRGQNQLTITHAIRQLISQGCSIKALDVSGKFWSDIDTPEDLRETEKFLKSPR